LNYQIYFIKCDNGKKILLSPEMPEEFMDNVAQALKIIRKV